jgi:DinB superfamily
MGRGDARISLLLQVLDEAFVAKGWQGTTLSGAVRGLTPRQALWRPRPGRHNVWELVLHTAYWKHVVRERVTGRERSPFPRGPRNFPRLPERCDAAAWRADVALLKRQHELLVAAVRRLPPARLGERVGKSRWVVGEQLFGIAAHDLYHTGQIQLLKALRRGR